MKTLLPIVAPLLLLPAAAAAQDLEPNAGRAAANLARRIVRLLPGLDAAPERLTVVPDRSADPAAVVALAEALADEGFRVGLARDGACGPRELGIFVSTARSEAYPRLAVDVAAPEPVRLVCLHGNADWVDDDRRGRLLVGVGDRTGGEFQRIRAAHRPVRSDQPERRGAQHRRAPARFLNHAVACAEPGLREVRHQAHPARLPMLENIAGQHPRQGLESAEARLCLRPLAREEF